MWTGHERRSAARSLIVWRLCYALPAKNRLHKKVHGGRTINMSRDGILFTIARQLPIATPLELSIRWSVQAASRLVVHGRLVRCDAAFAAMKVERFEVR
jgi:hypothetical protein